MDKKMRFSRNIAALGVGISIVFLANGCSSTQKLPSNPQEAQRAVFGYTPPASAAPMIAKAKADAAARAANAGPEIAKEMAAAKSSSPTPSSPQTTTN